MTSRPGRTAIALAFAVVLGAACSDTESVGSGVKKDGLSGAVNELGADSATTTSTTQANALVTVTTVATTRATVATTAPRATTPTTARATTTTVDTSVRVRITGAKDNRGFNPIQIQARVGTTVRFTNEDNQPRRAIVPDAGLDTGPIPPGGTGQFVVRRTGTFSMKDPQVPFATATLQVY